MDRVLTIYTLPVLINHELGLELVLPQSLQPLDSCAKPNKLDLVRLRGSVDSEHRVITPRHLRAIAESHRWTLTVGFRLFEGLAKHGRLLIVGPNSGELVDKREPLFYGFGFLQRVVTKEEHREVLSLAPE
jgi:hypothetical protein